jgi:hypothetical protein
MAGRPPSRVKAKLNIAALARQYDDKCIATLAKALDNEDMRIACDAAVRLLERGHGKPTQTIEHLDKTPDRMTDAELLEAIRTSAMAGIPEARKDKSVLN